MDADYEDLFQKYKTTVETCRDAMQTIEVLQMKIKGLKEGIRNREEIINVLKTQG